MQLLSALMFIVAVQVPAMNTRELAVIEAQRVVHCGTNLEIAIFPSGGVYEHLEDGCVNPKSESILHHVTAERVSDLLRLAERTSFFDLPDYIEPDTFISDEHQFVIRVRSGGRDKSVRAIGLKRARDPDSAKRFSAMWDAIMSLVPERDARLPNTRLHPPAAGWDQAGLKDSLGRRG